MAKTPHGKPTPPENDPQKPNAGDASGDLNEWEEVSNAPTFDLNDLSPEQLADLESLWDAAFDQNTNSGMTIKLDEDDPHSIDSASVQSDKTVASQEKSASDEPSEGEWNQDSVDATFVSDEFMPVDGNEEDTGEADNADATFISDEFMPVDGNEADDAADGADATFVSDEFMPVDGKESEAAADDSVDATFISDEFMPVDADAESDKTIPDIPGQGDHAESADATFISDEFMPVDADKPDGGVDSVDATFVSDEFMPVDEQAGDPGSVDSKQQFIDAPDEGSGQSSIDKTMISDEFDEVSAEEAAPGGKTEDFSGKPGQSDSYDQTMISDNFDSAAGTYASDPEGAGHQTEQLGQLEPTSLEGEGGLIIHQRRMSYPDDARPVKPEFEVQKLLGEGGMGQVYLAKQTSIERLVAVKMLKVKTAKKQGQSEKFLSEAVVTGDLDHPNIVPIYDVGRDSKGALFYTMKRVTGNPWSDLVRNKPLDDNLDILLRVADAVAFAHARGIVHRDLKPENVMVGEFGEVLVMDWGLAFPTDKFAKGNVVSKSHSMGGTPAYMAPEMATGPLTKIGTHSDIYLMGAILYEIVTRRAPHRGKNAMKCLMAAARNEIAETDVEGELVDIARKAMALNPEDRYPSIQAFQKAVRDYLQHEESIKLVDDADQALAEAHSSGNYDTYSEARHTYGQALKLWEENEEAAAGLENSRKAYANCAYGKGDFDLAASLLDQSDEQDAALLNEIAVKREERESRERRLRMAKRIGIGAAAVFLVTISGAAFWINSERAKAVAAEEIAVKEKDEADRQRGIAEEQKQVAVKQREQTEIQRGIAEEQRQIAVNALDDVKKARDLEAEQRKLAEAAQELAESRQVVAALNAQLARDQEVVANEKREEAVRERTEAERQKKIAEDQRNIAQANLIVSSLNSMLARDQEAEARRQTVIADQKRKEAQEQRELAEANEKRAKDNETLAKKNEATAKEQRNRAEAGQIVSSLNALLALDQEAAAKEQTEIAVKQTAIAVRQKGIADEQREIARAQTIVASLNAMLAEDQRALAVIEQKRAEAEKKRAEAAALAEYRAKLQQQYEAYVAQIGLAAAKIEENSFDVAREILEKQTNPKFRNWEWGYLMHLCSQSVETFNAGSRAEAVALVPNSEWFVVGGADGLLRMYKRGTGDKKDAETKDLGLGPNVRVHSLAVSADGQLLAAGTNDLRDGLIKLWKWDAGEERFVAQSTAFGPKNVAAIVSSNYEERLDTGHLLDVLGVTFSADGSKLLTGSLDHTARVWNVATGAQLARLQSTSEQLDTSPVRGVAFVPNGDDGETQAVTAYENGTVVVWSSATGTWQANDESPISHIAPFRGHTGPVLSVAVSPNGTHVASAGADGKILVWRTDGVKDLPIEERAELLFQGKSLPKSKYVTLLGHTQEVAKVRFLTTPSTGSMVLVSCASDNTVKVWQVDPKAEGTDVAAIKTFRGHGGWVRDCVFGPEGRWILSASHDRTIRRWSRDESASSEVHQVTGRALDAHLDPVQDVAFSFVKGAHRLLTASGDLIRVWEMEGKQERISQKPQHLLRQGHSRDARVPSAIFYDNGKKLVTSGGDRVATGWDVVTGAELFKFDNTGGEAAVAISPDGHWLVTGGDQNGETGIWSAQLWDTEKQVNVTGFGDHASQVTAVAISRAGDDGKFVILTGDRVGRARLWTWKPGDKQVQLAFELGTLPGGKAHNGRVSKAVFSPDGAQVTTASPDGVISAWAAGTGREILNQQLKHPGPVASMRFSHDGERIITSGNDRKVYLWEAKTGNMIREFSAKGRLETFLESVRIALNSKNASEDSLGRVAKLLLDEKAISGLSKTTADRGWQSAIPELIFQARDALSPQQSKLAEFAEKVAAVFPDVSADDLLKADTTSADLSADGKYILAVNRLDKLVHFWPADGSAGESTISYQKRATLEAAKFGPSGTEKGAEVLVLALGEARLWKLTESDNNADPLTAVPSVEFRAHDVVASVNVANDGKHFVSSGRDATARVWRVQDGKVVLKLTHGFAADPENTVPITKAVFSPDGKQVVTVDAYGKVALWDVSAYVADGGKRAPNASLKPLWAPTPNVVHSGEVTDAAFSPNGQWIVTVSVDQTARLLSAKDGKELATAKFKESVDCVTFNGQGNRFAVGTGRDAVILTIDETDGIRIKQELRLSGHSAPVTDLAFSPVEDLNGNGEVDEGEDYGLRVLTASRDNTLILWDTKVPLKTTTDDTEVAEVAVQGAGEEAVPAAKQILTLKRHERPVTSVSFSPDGRYVLTGSEDFRAILWPTENWQNDKLNYLKDEAKRFGDGLTAK